MSDFDSESDGEYGILDLKQQKPSLVEDEPCSSTSVSYFSTLHSRNEEYTKLETVLALNKMYDDKLRRLQEVLQSRLLECRRRLSEIKENKSNSRVYDKKETFQYARCGKPYFRDCTNQAAPDNEDTVLMSKTQMYDFSKISPVCGWTVNDKNQFLNLLLKMSQDKKKIELNSAIDKLKGNSMNVKTNEREIAILRREIDMVGKMNLKDIALPLEEEYDWDYIANNLKHRHTVLEYRALWKLFLHPTVNRNTWSKCEHTLLQKIASDEKLQDWNNIASLLGTGRTSYQCFVYFRINMRNTLTSKKWTKDEEEYLKRLIEYYKEDNYIPWGKVAASMDNRTKIQIYNKYSRLIVSRKGRFLPEEDAVILTCSDKFGANFKKMAKFLPGRSASQCRVRFQVLTKRRVSTVWTVEEDRKLVQLMANQDLSVNYSSISQYFPGKDRQHIRSRYLTLTKWMRRHPNVDIAMAPRRGARRLGHGRSLEDLNSAIQGLKSRIQSEEKDKRSNKIDMNASEGDIDDAILAVLVNEHTKLEAAKKHDLISSDNSDEDPDFSEQHNSYCNIRNLRKILILLRAKLDKNKFLQSPYAKKYKSLLEPDPDPLPELRSYCKKIPENNLKLDSIPDIWGTHCLEPLTHVLPPNYSTITGCKKIMSFISSQSKINEESININLMCKKNALLKDETVLLMERFNTLFLWPMLLASSIPEETMTLNMQNNVKQNLFKKSKSKQEDSD